MCNLLARRLSGGQIESEQPTESEREKAPFGRHWLTLLAGWLAKFNSQADTMELVAIARRSFCKLADRQWSSLLESCELAAANRSAAARSFARSLAR